MAEFDGMSLLGTYSQKFEAFTPLYNTVNQHLYITDLDSNIRVYDASTLPLTFVKDIGVADGVRGWIKTITYDPTTGLVYAASWDYGELYVIDGTTVTAVISTQTWGPEELLFDPIHNYIYIVGQEVDNRPVGYPAHNITVFDAAPPHQFRAGFATSTSSHRLGQDPLSGLVYAANRVADSVTIVNGLQMLGTVPVGAAPNDVAANPNTGYVFVANSNSNDITVLKNGAVVSTIASQGIRPYAIGIDSRNNYVYVANRGTEGHLSCTTNASVTIVR
jgi:DNA-binding beta-propeller fold protein YncE